MREYILRIGHVLSLSAPAGPDLAPAAWTADWTRCRTPAAQVAGLYVIARPGPYINAETDGGGIPSWVLTLPIATARPWNRTSRPPGSGTRNRRDHRRGPDNYPLGFNCAGPTGFGQPYGYPAQPGEPLYLPEYQGGSLDGWGGSGYDNCYDLTGPAFENVFYKNNIAQGVTMQSNYMGVGGTNWGWLPAPFVYPSYEYGAAIRETGEIGTPADPNAIAGSRPRLAT